MSYLSAILLSVLVLSEEWRARRITLRSSLSKNCLPQWLRHDGKAMRETATKDFQLLEHGEDWSMQKLIDAVQPKGKAVRAKELLQTDPCKAEG